MGGSWGEDRDADQLGCWGGGGGRMVSGFGAMSEASGWSLEPLRRWSLENNCSLLGVYYVVTARQPLRLVYLR